jgi:uncharacterized protein (TIGR02391 family)
VSEKLAIVATRAESDETAAPSIAAALGYRVIVPRTLSVQAIARHVPDVVIVDWAPGYVSQNTELVRHIRSNPMLRNVPICVLYSFEDNVPEAVLIAKRLVAFRIPVSPDAVRRALKKIGEAVPAPESSSRESSVNTPSLWKLIHPSVTAAAKPRFDSGQYADAAEAALKSVNARVKRLWLSSGQPEKDGKTLMLSAFSPNGPAIRLDDLSTESGRNIQEGYMYLFAGAMQAIRNPKAHDNLTITSERAWHFLMVASLLMWKLDDAAAA